MEIVKKGKKNEYKNLTLDKSNVTLFLQYEGQFSEVKNNVRFSIETLVDNGYVMNIDNISESNWFETKNYNWIAFKQDNFKMLVRQYGEHFTFYTALRIKEEVVGEGVLCVGTSYNIFTINTNTDHPDVDSDEYLDNPFKDVQKFMPQFLKMAFGDELYWLWNSSAIKFDAWVEVEQALSKSHFMSIDKYIFAVEELGQISRILYADFILPELLNPYITGEVKIPEGSCFNEVYIHDDTLYFKLRENVQRKDAVRVSRYYNDDLQKLINQINK